MKLTAKKAALFLLTQVLSLYLTAQNTSNGGYIQFVENLETIVLQAQSYRTILEAAALVQTNLSKLNIRRTVDPTHEAIYLQKGYDLNKDGLLNQLDGFESVDGEKFSPWNYYIEIMPLHCSGHQPLRDCHDFGPDPAPQGDSGYRHQLCKQQQLAFYQCGSYFSRSERSAERVFA